MPDDSSSDFVLVTGGAGFVGSNLVEALVRGGESRVVVLDNYFTGRAENHLAGAEYIRADTADIEAHVHGTPRVVFHLGEYARTEKSLQEPALVWEMNVMGTFAVAEFCKERRAKLIYAGSSTKFADGGAGRTQSPYALSKALNTELIRSYGEWYGLNWAIAYFYNVYGPREIAEGDYATVIAKFAHHWRNGQPLRVTRPGTQRRNFTHVDDIVAGLLLIEEEDACGEYSFGAEKSFTILEIAEMFGGEIEMVPENRGNRMDSTIDRTTAELLGWKASRSVEDYIRTLRAQS